jgi:hypothetical protein
VFHLLIHCFSFLRVDAVVVISFAQGEEEPESCCCEHDSKRDRAPAVSSSCHTHTDCRAYDAEESTRSPAIACQTAQHRKQKAAQEEDSQNDHFSPPFSGYAKSNPNHIHEQELSTAGYKPPHPAKVRQHWHMPRLAVSSCLAVREVNIGIRLSN